MFRSKKDAAVAGGYFVARNPTPGTPIEFVVNAAVNEYTGYFLAIRKLEPTEQNPAQSLVLDYIRLICGVAPASADGAQFFVKLTNNRRYQSGGTELTPRNANTNSSRLSTAKIYAGALTTVECGPDRLVAGGVLRTAIPVVGDEWLISFGASDLVDGYALTGGVAAERMVIPSAPCVVGVQQTALLQLWFPSNAAVAAQFEVEAGWHEE